MNATLLHTAMPISADGVRRTARPGASPRSAGDGGVVWFGQSQRLVGGQPDARYGWWPREDGPCIVKAMDPDLVAYNATLLHHERQTLRRLDELGAAAPTLVACDRPDWLVTRFAGLSLQRLDRARPQVGDPLRALAPAEWVSVFVHLLRRLQVLDAGGVLAIDVYPANVLLPLTDRVRGQFRLNEPVLVDHAHTLAAGSNLRRPVWIDVAMKHIAPELRNVLRRDLQVLFRRFHELDADLPGRSRLPSDRDLRSRRAWAEYDAPQELQRLLDSGRFRGDLAMQYAVGVLLSQWLAGSQLPAGERRELGKVAERMTAERPAQRFATLEDAASALQASFRALPRVSEQICRELGPDDLRLPDAAPRDGANDLAAPASARSAAQPGRRRRRAWLAPVVGAAIGAAVPLQPFADAVAALGNWLVRVAGAFF